MLSQALRYIRSTISRKSHGFVFSVLLVAANAHANTLLYWNGSAPNGPASGTWSASTTNLTWSANNLENAQNDQNPTSYTNSSSFPIPIFANGNATNGFPAPYTVTVDNSFGQVFITDMHCDVGPLTLTGGGIVWISDTSSGPGYNLISALGGQSFTINCSLSNAWNSSDGTAFHKYKAGALTLGATNKWTVDNSILIEGGSLTLAVAQSLPAGTAIILGNGDDRTSPGDGQTNTPATFGSGGFNQTLGTLTLTGPDDTVPRTLDLNRGSGTLSFADSSAISWTTVNHNNNSANPGSIPLMITNYALGVSKLRFGTSGSGLTSDQLSQIQFLDYVGLPGVIDTHGFVTPELPVFQSLAVSNSRVLVTWTNAMPSWVYEVDFSTNLLAPWQSQGDYRAGGASVTLNLSLFSSQGFYRLKVVGPN